MLEFLPSFNKKINLQNNITLKAEIREFTQKKSISFNLKVLSNAKNILKELIVSLYIFPYIPKTNLNLKDI